MAPAQVTLLIRVSGGLQVVKERRPISGCPHLVSAHQPYPSKDRKRLLEGEEAGMAQPAQPAIQQPQQEPQPQLVLEQPLPPPPLPVHTLHAVNMTEQLLAAYAADEDFASSVDQYDQDKHGLYRTKGKNQIVVPNCQQLKARILVEMHDAQFAGHVGITKTLERISRIFWWPRMRSEVRHYSDWPFFLSLAEFAVNNSWQESIQSTPFLVNTGQSPLTPALLELPGEVYCPSARKLSEWWQSNVKQARHFMEQAQQRQAYLANKGRREVEFSLGQLVLLSTKNLRLKPGKAKKLLPRFIGPFKVLEHVGPVAVRLDLPPAMARMHPVFHVALLRPYTSEHPHLPPPVDWLDEAPLYEVEKLLAHRGVRAGRARGYLAPAPPSGDAMLLLSGRPTRGEAPPFQPPDSLLWLRLRVAYMGVVWRLRSSGAATSLQVARRVVEEFISTPTTAVKRDWHRVGRDIRVGLCGAVPSTWFKGKDPELDAAHFDQLWPEASGACPRGGKPGLVMQRLGVAAKFMAVTLNVQGLAQPHKLQALLDWAADSPAQVQLQAEGAQGRVLRVDGELAVRPVPLVCVYAPAQQAERPTFHAECLPNCLPSAADCRLLLMGGDFNCVLAPVDRVGIPQGSQHGDARVGSRGQGAEQLRQLVGERELVDPWRHLHPSKRDLTHFSERWQTGARLDRGYISEELVHWRMDSAILGVLPVPTNYRPVSVAVCPPDRPLTVPAPWQLYPAHLDNPDLLDCRKVFLQSEAQHHEAVSQLRLPRDVGTGLGGAAPGKAAALAGVGAREQGGQQSLLASTVLVQYYGDRSSFYFYHRDQPAQAICVMPRGEGGVGLPDLGVTSTAIPAQLSSPRVRPWQPLTHSLLADPSYGLSAWIITDPTAPPSRGISPRLQAHVAALAELKLFRAVPHRWPILLVGAGGAAVVQRATGEPEVTAVADGALRELELKWEASAQQVAGQRAAGEREQQGRDVEERLSEEVQGSQPPRWLDTSVRAHPRPSPQERATEQAERQLEAQQRRGGRRPAAQPCAKVWKELLDPTLRREHVIVAWRVPHASLMVGALWGHILKGTSAPGSSACRFCQPGHLETLTHAFLTCPAVVPAWEWVLDIGRPTRGEAPPFQPPDSLLWLRLRVAYMGVVWRLRSSGAATSLQVARRVVEEVISTPTTAVKRDWHRVGRDIRVGLCGAVPSTWFKGKDPELDAAHFDQLWPEASGACPRGGKPGLVMQRLGVAAKFMAVTLNVQGLAQPHKLQALLDWAADSPAQVQLQAEGAQGRVLRVDGELAVRPVPLVCVYAPAQQAERPTFHAECLPNCLLMGGDFNCVLAPVDRVGIPQGSQHGDARVGSRGQGAEQLRQLVGERGLVDPWRHLHPSKRDLTHFSERWQTGARLDRGYISEELVHWRMDSAILGVLPVPTNYRPVSVAVCPHNRPLTVPAPWQLYPAHLDNPDLLDCLKVFLQSEAQHHEAVSELRLPRDVGTGLAPGKAAALAGVGAREQGGQQSLLASTVLVQYYGDRSSFYFYHRDQPAQAICVMPRGEGGVGLPDLGVTSTAMLAKVLAQLSSPRVRPWQPLTHSLLADPSHGLSAWIITDPTAPPSRGISPRLQAHVAALAELKLFRAVPHRWPILLDPVQGPGDPVQGPTDKTLLGILTALCARTLLGFLQTLFLVLQTLFGLFPTLAGEPEVTAVADGALRELELKWEASAQQVAGQRAAGEREQQGRDVEERLSEEVQGSQPPRWLDTSVRAHPRPSPQERATEQAERQLEAQQRRGGRRPAAQPCAKVWKELLDPTLRREHVIVAWRVPHASLMVGALWGHILKGTAAPGSSACRFRQPGHLETLTHAFLTCPAVVPAWEWVLDMYGHLTGTRPPSGDAMLLLNGRPTRGEAPPFQPPDSLLWLRLRVAYMGVVWRLRSSGAATALQPQQVARRVVEEVISTPTMAVKRDWHRVGRDIRMGLCGAVPSTWFKGKDPELDAAHFDQLWPEASGACPRGGKPGLVMQRLGVAANFMAVTLNVQGLAQPHKLQALLDWAADSPAQVQLQAEGAQGRVLRVDGEPAVRPVPLVCVYAPAQQAERPTFHAECLPNCLPSAADCRLLLMGGDFNCVLAPVDRVGIPQGSQHGDARVGSRGQGAEQLRQLVGERGLVDPWRHLHPSKRDLTHFSERWQTGARLDRGYISEELVHWRMDSAILGVLPVPTNYRPLSVAVCPPDRPLTVPAPWQLYPAHLDNPDLLDCRKVFLQSEAQHHEAGLAMRAHQFLRAQRRAQRDMQQRMKKAAAVARACLVRQLLRVEREGEAEVQVVQRLGRPQPWLGAWIITDPTAPPSRGISPRLQAHVAALAELKLFRAVPHRWPILLVGAGGAAVVQRATGEPEVTAVADGALRELELKWEASAQQVAGQRAAGEREQQGRDVEERLSEEVQGSQPPRWLDTSVRAHPRPSPQERATEQAERQLEAQQRRGGRRPAAQPCAKVWKELLDPTLRREHVIVAWRVPHASLMAPAPPSGDAMLLLSGRPTRGEAPPFQPPDSLLWLRLRVAYMGVVWRLRSSGAATSLQVARRVVEEFISTPTTAVKRDWHRVGRDIRVGLCGAVPSTWFKGKDPELDAAHFDQLWPEASGACPRGGKPGLVMQRLGVAAKFMAVTLNVQGLAQPHKLQALLDWAADSPAQGPGNPVQGPENPVQGPADPVYQDPVQGPMTMMTLGPCAGVLVTLCRVLVTLCRVLVTL
ncbi:hypothetical protein QJQ45_023134 [Haematococcus lacustris]|nr:hypothetical protein QJQ45_023134 [Haematococcus lacustris]